MFRHVSAAAALALGALALPAAASAQFLPVSVGVSAGPSFPTGHFAEEAGTGFNVQGSLGLDVPALPVGLRADLLWQRFPDEHEGSFTEVGGLLNATAGLPLPLARPYVVGGVGLVHHDAPEEEHGDHVHEGESGSSFAFNVGAGVQLSLLGLSGVLEARYLDAGEDHRSFPVSFGVRF